MADPLASWMWTRLTEPPLIDHAVVDVDGMFSEAFGAAVKTLPLDSTGAGGGRGARDFGDVPEDRCLQHPTPPRSYIYSRCEQVVGHGTSGRESSSLTSSWQAAGYADRLSALSFRDTAEYLSGDSLEGQIYSKVHQVRGSDDRPYIWKVPPGIRDHEETAYGPNLISIGPFHHYDKSLQPMEELKLEYLRDLLLRSSKNKIGGYIKVVREIEPHARKQYSEDLKDVTSDDFVKMLVVDGCFIIECFLKRLFTKQPQEHSPTFSAAAGRRAMIRWRFSHLRRDMLLFENQIPFFVLVALFNKSVVSFPADRHRSGDQAAAVSFVEIALEFLKIKLPRDKHPAPDQVHHLLHLHHMCLNPSLKSEVVTNYRRRRSAMIRRRLNDAAITVSLVLISLPFLLLTRKPSWMWAPFEGGSHGRHDYSSPKMIPCATELKNAGVRFQRRVLGDGDEEVGFSVDVRFEEGALEIPFLHVDEWTSSKLRNFIALEQCCPELGSHFTAYAVLMDNVINTEKDVTLLRKHRIIEKRLGNDQQVADMFNRMCKGTYHSYKDHSYEQLYREVNVYCDVPHHKWRASLMGEYFRNPWSIISVVGGSLLFVLSVVQTYFSIAYKSRHD